MTRWMVGLALAIVLLAVGGAAAEPGARDRALALAREGVALYNEGRFVDAYERFERAEGLVHSPAFVLYMARARRNQGKLVAALKLMEKVRAEVLPEDAPPAWVKAVREAREELPPLRARVPSLRISLSGGSGAVVLLDGLPVQPARLGEPIPVDPGKHELVARREGEPEVRRQVQVPEGQAETPVELRLGPALPPAAGPPPEADAPTKKRDKGLMIAGGIMGGFGGLCLMTGVSLGLPALVMSDTVASSTTDTMGYAAIGLLAGGAVIGGVGLTLFIIGNDTSPDEPSAALHVGPAAAELTLRF